MPSRILTFSKLLIVGIASIVTCINTLRAQDNDNYGLLFQSYNVAQERRTSFEVGQSTPLDLGSDFSLNFYLNFVQNKIVYFGYVFRLVNQAGQRISLLYDQKNLEFRLTLNGAYANINFPKTGDWLFENWNRMAFNFHQDSVSCKLNGHLLGTAPLTLNDGHFILVFGGGKDSQFNATDVPPMKLKDIEIIKEGKPLYRWPLRFGKHNQTQDELQDKMADLSNPVWLLNLHTHWELLQKRLYSGSASVDFDPITEQLYVLDADSVYNGTVQADNELTWKVLPSKGFTLFSGNHLVYNTKRQLLYNVYIDSHSISAYNPAGGSWDSSFHNVPRTEFNQANLLYDATGNALYIIGGYGQMRYKNFIQRYSFDNNNWDTLPQSGEFFSPRYLAASALVGDTIYIIGGYGSKTGDQLLDPGYFYDCMAYNIKTHQFKRKFVLKDTNKDMIIGGSMIVDSTDRTYYVFGFPNDRYQSELQLFKGSLDRPGLTAVGDKIPYSFNDVHSRVRLCYSKRARKLLVFTSIDNEAKGTEIAIYSISFPPNLLDSSLAGLLSGLSGGASSAARWEKVLLAALLLLIIGGAVIVFKRRRRKKAEALKAPDENDTTVSTPARPVLPVSAVRQTEGEDKGELREDSREKERAVTAGTSNRINRLSNLDLLETPLQVDLMLENEALPKTSVIQLFGNFEILDKEGHSIAAQLSPLLKELFLVILMNTVVQHNGIASRKLNELFWNNKSDKDANNNRSVNIAKLKNILDKVESLTLVNDHGKWFVSYDPQLAYIDLAQFMEMLQGKEVSDRKNIRKILSLFQRGSLLKNTEYDWLDEFKSKISNRVIDALIGYTRHLDPARDTELYIEISNAIFSFDPINEQALTIKCKALAAIGRHSIAQSTYQHYSKEYLKMYGEAFDRSFSDIVSG